MKNCCYFGLLVAALVSRSGMPDVVHTTFGMSDEYASVGTPVGHAGGVSQVNITETQSFSIPDGASYRLDSFEGNRSRAGVLICWVSKKKTDLDSDCEINHDIGHVVATIIHPPRHSA
jgi:hypothetical protein